MSPIRVPLVVLAAFPLWRAPRLLQFIKDRVDFFELNGFVYFDVDTFPDYGKLSHNTVDQLTTNHRLDTVDAQKRQHYDFTLWRASVGKRAMSWDSPWGHGYPGWHIECSAMSLKHLGETFDIHTGGADLIFPHHEDEIAQSQGAVGHPVVGIWVHGGFLQADQQKMAKSRGNITRVSELPDQGIAAFGLLRLGRGHQHKFRPALMGGPGGGVRRDLCFGDRPRVELRCP